MVVVRFTLKRADGVELREDQTRPIAQVPGVGEFATACPSDSFLVVDVLWHLPAGGEPYVTVTAIDWAWHVNLREIETEWRAHGWGRGQSARASPEPGW